jgi:DNA-binding response OmpR family regulator
MNAPLSILFADRDLAATRPHRMGLRRQGARVEYADAPADVARRAEHDPPDLLVLDETLLQTGAEEDLIGLYQRVSPATEIVLLHDGTASMPHGLGLGLLFSSRKPISAASLREVIEGAFPGRLGPEPSPPSAPPPILCVDDDPEYRVSISRLLRRRGYTVVAAESAHEALDALARFPFGAVLVDIMMQGMDGIGLTHEIRERAGGRVPILVLTGLATDEAAYLALENGARFCLTKPFDPEELLNVVDYVTGTADAEERQLLERRFAASSIPKSTA